MGRAGISEDKLCNSCITAVGINEKDPFKRVAIKGHFQRTGSWWDMHGLNNRALPAGSMQGVCTYTF